MPILGLSLPCPDPHSDLIGVDGTGLGVSPFFFFFLINVSPSG